MTRPWKPSAPLPASAKRDARELVQILHHAHRMLDARDALDAREVERTKHARVLAEANR